MHNRHETTSYAMSIFEDERLEALTFPNIYLSNDKKLSFKNSRYESSNYFNREFVQRLDQRVSLMLYPRVVESDQAYDCKVFTSSNMPHSKYRDLVKKNKNQGNSNNIESNLRLVPCAQIKKKWVPMSKNDYSKMLQVKLLAKDKLETYSVLDNTKLFDTTKVSWCANVTPSSSSIATTIFEPILKIAYDETNCKFNFQYEMSDTTLYDITVLRFFSRFRTTPANAKTSLNNKKFYDQLISNEQFNMNFYEKLGKTIEYRNFTPRSIVYKQILHGGSVSAKNSRDEASTAGGSPKEPRLRLERCLTAYNPTTKEFVVQCMPLIEDPLPVFSDKQNPSTCTMDYQTWFYNFLKESETFLSGKLPPMSGCKRRIFTLRVEHYKTHKIFDNSYMSAWTQRQCSPLSPLRLVQ